MRKGLSKKWRIRMDMLTDIYEEAFECVSNILMVVSGYLLLSPIYFLFFIMNRIEGCENNGKID